MQVKNKYFSDIFQSKKTIGMPKVTDMYEEMNDHNMYVPLLDDILRMEELEKAIDKSGKGTSFDGLTSDVIQIVPNSLKDIILVLMQRVFSGKYPTSWETVAT